MEDNNINGKIAKDRDVWLNMEEHILGENPEYQKKVAEYNKLNAHVLYAEAIELIKEIESGKLEDEQIKKNVHVLMHGHFWFQRFLQSEIFRLMPLRMT